MGLGMNIMGGDQFKRQQQDKASAADSSSAAPPEPEAAPKPREVCTLHPGLCVRGTGRHVTGDSAIVAGHPCMLPQMWGSALQKGAACRPRRLQSRASSLQHCRKLPSWLLQSSGNTSTKQQRSGPRGHT